MDAASEVRVLLVEDDPSDATVVERLLVEHGGQFDSSDFATVETIDRVDTLASCLERLADGGQDIVLLDLGLPDSDGLETVDRVADSAGSTPIIVLTGQQGVGREAIRRGAQDYLVKGRISGALLHRTISYAIERGRMMRDLRDQAHQLTLLNDILRSDLRNDLSMVVGWGDHLRDRVPPDQREAVDAMLAASRHALELTDTAGAIVDVLGPDRSVRPEPCDLRPILTAELEALEGATDAQVTVDWQVSERTTLPVMGTPMLGSVFDQLLSNAVTHTDRDRPTVAVTVRATDETVTVEIADDGYGMSRTQRASIGQPEASGEPTESPELGAGLYFVTAVLESIEGALVVEDNVPRGTVVTATLRRHRRDGDSPTS